MLLKEKPLLLPPLEVLPPLGVNIEEPRLGIIINKGLL
jgi:hypothetical protein